MEQSGMAVFFSNSKEGFGTKCQKPNFFLYYSLKLSKLVY